MSRLVWCVELWISSDTLFSRSCRAGHPSPSDARAQECLSKPNPLFLP